MATFANYWKIYKKIEFNDLANNKVFEAMFEALKRQSENRNTKIVLELIEILETIITYADYDTIKIRHTNFLEVLEYIVLQNSTEKIG